MFMISFIGLDLLIPSTDSCTFFAAASMGFLVGLMALVQCHFLSGQVAMLAVYLYGQFAKEWTWFLLSHFWSLCSCVDE